MTDEEQYLRFGIDTRRVLASEQTLKAWQQGVISLFALIVDRYNGDAEAAWEAVKESVLKLHPDVGPDDLDWPKELVKGERKITQEEAQRILSRYPGRSPLIDGLTAVIQESNGQ